MKKKLLLTLLVVMTLVCLFAIAVSAENVYDKTEKFTTADGTELALYDASGAPLAWFKDPTTNEYVSYRVLTDFTATLGSNREIHTNNKTLNATDGTTFPYSLDNLIVFNAREYAAFTYISGTWSSMPIEAIYVNDNFQWINKNSFQNNTTLKVFDIPKEQKATKLHIGGSAFNSATALESFYISQNAAFESTSTFQSAGLKTVEFASDWATGLKGYDFYLCKSLTTVIGLENTSITKIPVRTFSGCSSLSSVALPSTLTTIEGNPNQGYGAFQNCSALKSITIPASVTKIGGYTFASSGLETITFEKRTLVYDEEGNLTNGLDMGEYAAFENCKSLTALVLPEGLTKIGNCFAKSCSALASLTLPSTLSALDGSQQFYGTALTEVIGLENTKLTYLSSEMFRNLRTWKPDVIRLPNTCTTLYGYALADVGMKTLYLGASFEKFEGNNPITGCSSLKTIYAPATATTIPLGNSGTTTVYLTTTDETAISAIKTSTGITQVVSLADYIANPGNYTSGKWIITGYNLCDAFYGEHAIEEGTGVNQFKGEMYVTNYVCISGCTRNCGKQAETVICGPLFVNKGYSKIADGTSFTYGIVINEENITKYLELTGATGINYGFIIGAADVDENGNVVEKDAIIDNEGNSLIEKAITADFATVEFDKFTIYNVKMTGIDTVEQQSKLIYCCAYVIDGDNVYYMGNSVSEKPETISSSTIEVIEAVVPENTPSNDEE